MPRNTFISRIEFAITDAFEMRMPVCDTLGSKALVMRLAIDLDSTP
jgi:hypothetical protein